MKFFSHYVKTDRLKPLDDLAKTKTQRLFKKFILDGAATWNFSKYQQNYLSEIYLECDLGEFYARTFSDNFFKTLEPSLLKIESQLKIKPLLEQLSLEEVFV